MLQGLQLLDILMVDHERVQSLAIACDRDAVLVRGVRTDGGGLDAPCAMRRERWRSKHLP